MARALFAETARSPCRIFNLEERRKRCQVSRETCVLLRRGCVFRGRAWLGGRESSSPLRGTPIRTGLIRLSLATAAIYGLRLPSSAFVGLPPFSDFAGAMSLEMSLGANVFREAFTLRSVELALLFWQKSRRGNYGSGANIAFASVKGTSANSTRLEPTSATARPMAVQCAVPGRPLDTGRRLSWTSGTSSVCCATCASPSMCRPATSPLPAISTCPGRSSSPMRSVARPVTKAFQARWSITESAS
jgi:hypothetical protein